MSLSRQERLEHLFERVSGLSAQERARVLEREAGDDGVLEAELSRLAAASDGAESFLERLRQDVLGSSVQLLLHDAPTLEPADPWIGRAVSHYHVSERIADGGMGVVYRARDLLLGRTVALKFIAPELGRAPGAERLFIQEARAVSALDHPNICTIHEIAETDGGRLFIVMPAYEGETLRSRLEGGLLSRDEAIDIGLQVARAVAAAHERGIVHGDVKPGNVFITDEGVVKLLDFGLARRGDSVAGEGLRGTAAYTSPEQTLGEAADERSDVWAVGAVLFEMLTGQRVGPTHGPHGAAAGGRPSTDIATIRPAVGRDLVHLIERALSHDPQRRPPNGTHLLRALETCPPLGRRTPSRAWLPGRRLPYVAAVVGVLGAGWVWHSARGSSPGTVAAARVTHVLWADDNPENNADLVTRLEERGVEVETVLSTTEALERYDPGLFQLVVSDVGRYEGEGDEYVDRAGFQLLAELKERDPGVEVLFYTSDRAVAAYREQASAAGALAIVSSPADVLSIIGL